jgi:hypothetical protein
MDQLHREYVNAVREAIEGKALDMLVEKAVAAGVPDTAELRDFLGNDWRVRQDQMPSQTRRPKGRRVTS